MRPLQIAAITCYSLAGIWTIRTIWVYLAMLNRGVVDANNSSTNGEAARGAGSTIFAGVVGAPIFFFIWLLPFAFLIIIAIILQANDKKKRAS